MQACLPGTVVQGTHCCLYTVSGAAFVLRLLDKLVDIQWDAAVSVASVFPTGGSTAFLWVCSHGARQRLHFSSIQDLCITCSARGALPFVLLVGIILLSVLAGVGIAKRKPGSWI